MADWRSRRSLRRTQGSRVLRGTKELHPAPSSAMLTLEDSPIKVRRMKSNTSIDTVDLHLTPRASTRDCAPNLKEYNDIVNRARQEVDFDHEDIPPHHKDSLAGIETPPTFSRPFTKPSVPTPQPERRVASAASIESTTSTSSVIRFCPTFPDRHKQRCICTTCRAIRHTRRKAALKLYQKLEACRHIVMTIRNPQDPSNFERGRAWGHWLKLAGLYCKYETLPDIPVVNFDEENMLFERFMGAFSALVRALEYEKEQWWHLFNGSVEFGIATLHEQTTANRIQVPDDFYEDEL